MLKKFKDWFNQEPPDSLVFTAQTMNVNGVPYTLRRMLNTDIDGALTLERAIYQNTPWDRMAFLSELRKTGRSLYLVLEGASGIVAFVGCWMTKSEAHVTNLAVAPQLGHQGIGTALMTMMIQKALDFGSERMTLEVRTDNVVAQALYHKLGFHDGRIKRGYYVADHADAMDMWKILD